VHGLLRNSRVTGRENRLTYFDKILCFEKSLEVGGGVGGLVEPFELSNKVNCFSPYNFLLKGQ